MGVKYGMAIMAILFAHSFIGGNEISTANCEDERLSLKPGQYDLTIFSKIEAIAY